MARYFEQFPLMLYDIKANGYYKLVPDIFPVSYTHLTLPTNREV